MNKEEIEALKKRLDEAARKHGDWTKKIGEEASKLPAAVPIASGPANQKQLQKMLKDMKDAKKP